jgi:hypothetical protein
MKFHTLRYIYERQILKMYLPQFNFIYIARNVNLYMLCTEHKLNKQINMHAVLSDFMNTNSIAYL